MTADRIALALEGQARRKAAHLYGEILAYVAERPAPEELRKAFDRVLAYLDQRRAIT